MSKDNDIFDYPVGDELTNPRGIAMAYLLFAIGNQCTPNEVFDRGDHWIVTVAVTEFVFGREDDNYEGHRLKVGRRNPEVFELKIDKTTRKIVDPPNRDEVIRSVRAKRKHLTECPFCGQAVEEVENERTERIVRGVK